MSRTTITTHDLFLRLGATTRLRSARADAVFRRLRFDTPESGNSADATLAKGATGAKGAKTSELESQPSRERRD